MAPTARGWLSRSSSPPLSAPALLAHPREEPARRSTRSRSARGAPTRTEVPSGGAPLSQWRDAAANVVLYVADDGTLGDPMQRQDVADGERGRLSAIDELACVHAFGGAPASSRNAPGSREAQPSSVSKKRKSGAFGFELCQLISLSLLWFCPAGTQPILCFAGAGQGPQRWCQRVASYGGAAPNRGGPLTIFHRRHL